MKSGTWISKIITNKAITLQMVPGLTTCSAAIILTTILCVFTVPVLLAIV